jgi:hypothetical protein
MAKGLVGVEQHLKKVEGFFKSPAFTSHKEQLAKLVIQDIVAGAMVYDVNNVPYADYSDAYTSRKAKTHPGQKFMSRTGAALGIPMRPNNFSFRILPNAILIEYDGPKYMAYHQRGDKPQPQRKWFGISRRSTMDAIRNNIRNALENAVKALGRK